MFAADRESRALLALPALVYLVLWALAVRQLGWVGLGLGGLLALILLLSVHPAPDVDGGA